MNKNKEKLNDDIVINSILELEETNNDFLMSIKNQINEKSLQIVTLEEKNTLNEGVLKVEEGNNNCNPCPQVNDFLKTTKLLVDYLLGVLEDNKEKIEELGMDIIKLEKDKVKLEKKKKQIEIDKEKLLNKNDKLKEKAYRDSLTGLYNRHYMEKEINNNIERSKNIRAYKFSVGLIDLDFFKLVNDTYGHDAGDKVLKSFSNFMTSRLDQIENAIKKDNDRRNIKRNILFRYGGEEFLVLSELSSKQLKIFLDKCLDKFSDVVHVSEGNNFFVSFSAGISEYKPGEVDSFELIRNSDIALYEAKNRGRKKVIIDTEID